MAESRERKRGWALRPQPVLLDGGGGAETLIQAVQEKFIPSEKKVTNSKINGGVEPVTVYWIVIYQDNPAIGQSHEVVGAE